MQETRTSKRRQRSDTGPRITARDLAALAWIAQQYAISLDHLAILLARLTEPGQYARTPKEAGELTQKRAKDVVRKWQALGLVEKKWILHGAPEWIYLTLEGLRLVAKDLGQLRTYTPTPAKVEHLYHVNLARLYIEQRRPDAQWTSERQLCAGQKIETGKKQPHRPDAVIMTHNRQQEPVTVAVEIELTPKTRARLDKILQELARDTRYNSVWYFACDRAYKLVKDTLESKQEYKQKMAVYDLDSLKGDNTSHAKAE